MSEMHPAPGGGLDTRLVSGTCPACGRAVDAAERSWGGCTLIAAEGDKDLPEPIRRAVLALIDAGGQS